MVDKTIVIKVLHELESSYNSLTVGVASTNLAGYSHSYGKHMEVVIKDLNKEGFISLKNGVITINPKTSMNEIEKKDTICKKCDFMVCREYRLKHLEVIGFCLNIREKVNGNASCKATHPKDKQLKLDF